MQTNSYLYTFSDATQNNTGFSSVGRAEDCSMAVILRSLVRIRQAGSFSPF